MVDTKQLIQELSQQAAPVKAAQPRTWATRLIVVLLAYGGMMLWMMGLRPDLHAQLVRPMFGLEIALLAALLFSSAVASILAMYPDAYQKRALLKVPYVLAAAMIAMVAFQLFIPHDTRMVMPDEHSHSSECAMFIAMAAMLPSALIFMLLRKGAPIAPLNAGALAVITSATVGALTLRLSEAIDAIPHLLMWHYIPSVMFACIGAWIGRSLLKW